MASNAKGPRVILHGLGFAHLEIRQARAANVHQFVETE